MYSRTAKVYETLGEHQAAAEQYAHATPPRPANTYARIVALDLVASAEMCTSNAAASSRRAPPGTGRPASGRAVGDADGMQVLPHHVHGLRRSLRCKLSARSATAVWAA